MPRLLQIAQLGHPVLRTPAVPVPDPSDPEIRALVGDMLATMAENRGFGLAAPQVYAPLRLFVFTSYPGPTYPTAPDVPPGAAINPEILCASPEAEVEWEGCLSVPGIFVRVTRPRAVRVRYLTREGDSVEADLEGLPARVFQHELDHLDGVVHFDRMAGTRDIVTLHEFQRLKSAPRAREDGAYGDDA